MGSVTNSGTVNPGKAPQGLTIVGSYTQTPQGKLLVDIDGNISTNNYSMLRVEGRASLDGKLEMRRANQFVPDLWADYVVVSAGAVVGEFSEVAGGAVADGNDLMAQYGSSVAVVSRAFDRIWAAEYPHVNGQPGERVFLDVRQVTEGPVTFRVYDPQGGLVFASNATAANPDLGDGGPFLLGAAGEYTVRAYAPPGIVPAYDWRLAPAPLVTKPLTLNERATGTIAVPGETHEWLIQVDAATTADLDVHTIIGEGQELSYTLFDPAGRPLLYSRASGGNPAVASRGPLELAKKGTYRLVVKGIGDDVAAYQVSLLSTSSPHIRAHALRNDAPGTVNSAWFHFAQPMDTSEGNFDLNEDLIVFENAHGALAAENAQWHNARTLVITFAPQPADEPLFMVLAPTILSAAGIPLDQNGNGIPGEMPGDEYFATLRFDGSGPRVVHTEPPGRASLPLSNITFYFNEPIAPDTFSLADVSAFSGPNGDLLDRLTDFLVGKQSVTVYFAAQWTAGQYTISIGPHIADAASNWMDQNRDGRGGQPDDVFTLQIDVHAPDLRVASVANPVGAVYGQTIDLAWTVRNDGTEPAQGTWWDYVYLSADDCWDASDTLVGRFYYDSAAIGAVPPGGSYQGTLSAPLPGLFPGNYHVIVRGNLLRSVAESSYTNNTGISASRAYFDIPQIVSGTPVTGQVDYREALYYRINVTPGTQTLLVRFGTDTATAANELYVRRSGLPTRQTHDARSQQAFSSNQWITVSFPEPGTYYILALAAPDQFQLGPLGSFTLQASFLAAGEFQVFDTYFGQGGTAGNRTIAINGANFDRTITVSLSDGTGFTQEAVSYYRVGLEKLYATFDLTQVTPGVYDVVLENSAGQEQVVAAGFEVVYTTEVPEIDVNITAPPAFRRVFHAPWVHFPVTVSWSNSGLNDITLPILQFVSTEPFGASASAVLSGNGTNVDTFFGLGDSETVLGLLMPGEAGSAIHQVVPRPQQHVSGNEHVSYTVIPFYDEPAEPFNWDGQKYGLRADYLDSPGQFDGLFEQFKAAMGTTNAHYSRVLWQSYLTLPSLPEDVWQATDAMVQEAFDRFAATVTPSIIGQIDYASFDIAIEALTVTAVNTTTFESSTTTVRRDGQFVLPNLGNGTFVVTVSGGAVATTPHFEVTVGDGQPTRVDVPILRGGATAGTIQTTSGVALADARVSLHSAAMDLQYTVFSGVDGTFAIDDVYPGTYDLTIDLAPYLAYATSITIDPSQTVSDAHELIRGATLQGLVSDADSGSPIAEAQVWAKSTADGALLLATTAADGTYQLPGLAVGDWELTFAHIDYIDSAAQAFNVSSATTYTKNQQLSLGASVSGTITDEQGAPVADATVALSSNGFLATTLSAADGTYTIAGIPAGDFGISVSTASFVDVAEPVTGIVVQEQRGGVDFVLSPGHDVAGQVLDSVGNPIKGALVMLISDTGDAAEYGISDESGHFTTSHLSPGMYACQVRHEGHLLASRQVDLTSGDVLDLQISLLESASVTGAITDSAGQAVAEAVVLLTNANGDTIAAAISGTDGTYELADLPAGTFFLAVHSNTVLFDAVEIITSEGDVLTADFSAIPGRVHGVVTDENGDPVADATVTLISVDPLTGEERAIMTTTAADGSYELASCPEGEVTITVNAADGQPVSETAIGTRGAELRVNVVIAAATELSLNVEQALANLVFAADASCADKSASWADAIWAEIQAKINRRDVFEARLAAMVPTYNAAIQKFNDYALQPWPVPLLVPDGPAMPPDCCNNGDLVDKFNAIDDMRDSLIFSRALIELEIAAWDVLRDTTKGLFVLDKGTFDFARAVAEAQVVEAGSLIGAAATALLALATGFPLIGPAAAFITPITNAISYAALVLILVDAELKTAEGACARMWNDATAIELLWKLAKQRVDDFDSKIPDLEKEIDEYNKMLAEFECEVPPEAVSGSLVTCVGQSESLQLIPEGALDGLDYSIIVLTADDGISIDNNGKATLSSSNCGTFKLRYILSVTCRNQVFAIPDQLSYGTVTGTVNPETHPSCGTPPTPGDCEQLVQELNEATGCTEWKIKPVYSAQCGAFDPNDIIGPWGIGEEHWIDSQSTLDYMIRYENDPEKASAPAAVVHVTQQLDDDLDWTTFRLGTMGFGDVVINGAVGKSSYESRLDYRDRFGIYIDVRAGLNISTGEAFWELKSIDPETGQMPFNPFLGFLPPNREGSEGEGFFNYSIRPKADLLTGTRIDAVASIIFDQNETIDTPPIFNTIDAGAPTSSVEALPAWSYPDFLVRWSGEDDEGGSGVAKYDVYVSVNDGPFERWLYATQLTEATFDAAVVGNRYAFYSVATDWVGHVEFAIAVADTHTEVVEAPEAPAVRNVTVIREPLPVISVEFNEPMDLEAAIADGSLRDAISLVQLTNGPLTLSDIALSYDDASRTLTIGLGEALSAGFYELQLDSSLLRTAAGEVILGGVGGLSFPVVEFHSAGHATVAGFDIQVDAYSAPAVTDWNGNGLTDLIVGEKTAAGQGKVRIYLNQGTNAVPVFETFTYAQTATGDLAVAASGCLGVSPRVFDWDGDGRQDLILGLSDGRVQLWTNAGTASQPIFTQPEYLTVGLPGAKSEIHVGGRAMVEIVDWNNDGRYDLLVGGQDGRVRLFLNEAASGPDDFRETIIVQNGASDLVVPTGRASVAVADLNGDGRKDLLLGNTAGQLWFYANVGTDVAPAFGGGVLLAADGAAINLGDNVRSRPFIGDWNADGLPDVLVGSADGRVWLASALADSEPLESPWVYSLPGALFQFTFQVPDDENVAPSVGILIASPDPVQRPRAVTLTATDVHDQDGSVTRVSFYHDSNHNSVWESGIDQYLGSDMDSGDGWSLGVSTAGWALGQHTLFARAQDNHGAWSEVVAANVTVQLGTYRDSTPPEALLLVSDIATAEGAMQFTVTFTDDVAVNVATLGDGNLRVRGPGMFQQQATLVSVSQPTNGPIRTATFRIPAPDGSWQAGDSGHYEIWMLPLQVADLDGNYASFGRLGTFAVTIDPGLVGDIPDEAVGQVADERFEILDGQLRLVRGRSPSAGGEPTMTVSVIVPDTASPQNPNPMEIPVSIWTTPWQNPVDRLDVNDDGRVYPIDALLIINQLNAGRGGPLRLVPAHAELRAPYLDVNGDHQLYPIDALLVINQLNRRSGSGGAGTGGAFAAVVPPEDPRLVTDPTPPSTSLHPFLASSRTTTERRQTPPESPGVMATGPDQDAESEPAWLDSMASVVRAGTHDCVRTPLAGRRARAESDLDELLSEFADDVATAWSGLP